jgi:hypothetical protein
MKMVNQLEYIPTLIIGASMLGLGVAFSKGKEAVTLEYSSAVGNEFIRSFKLADQPYQAASSKGLVIGQECLARNAMSADGKLHLPGLMHVLVNQLSEAKLDVRLLTSVVEVNKHKDQFEVLVYDASGLRTIITDQLIDTTPYCVTRPGQWGPASKSLNMMIHGWSQSAQLSETAHSPELKLEPAGTKTAYSPNRQPESSPLLQPNDAAAGYAIKYGRFAPEVILEYPLDIEDNWAIARNKLFTFWLNRPEALRTCSFVTHADEFNMKYNQPHHHLEPGWDWYPSAFYDNPLEAFDHGYQHRMGVQQ